MNRKDNKINDPSKCIRKFIDLYFPESTEATEIIEAILEGDIGLIEYATDADGKINSQKLKEILTFYYEALSIALVSREDGIEECEEE